ncbi:MAG: hypothetical protein L6244_02270 [Candidatus Methanoperedenaceae archaeon]|nr:hypothetical protein [Candidatus Methanoperedenaceae archaeon]
MSAEIRRELEKLSIEIEDLKKLSYFSSKQISPEIKLKRYHALLNRISKSPEVEVTPDELISLLKRKEY